MVEGLLDEEDLYELHVFRGRFEMAPENLVVAVSVQAMSLLPAEIAERFWVVPVRVSFDGSGARLLYLATTDPEDSHSLSELAAYTDSKVIPLVARFSKIGDALNHWYGIDVPSLTAPKDDTLDADQGGPPTRPFERIATDPAAIEVDVEFGPPGQTRERTDTDPEPVQVDSQPPPAASPEPMAAAPLQAPRAGAPTTNPFEDMPRPQLRMTSMHGDLDGERPEPEAVPPHVAAWAGFNRLQTGSPEDEDAMPGADTLDDPEPPGDVVQLDESDLMEAPVADDSYADVDDDDVDDDDDDDVDDDESIPDDDEADQAAVAVPDGPSPGGGRRHHPRRAEP